MGDDSRSSSCPVRFTLIGDDLSLNSFGRVYILAEAAARLGSVEIIGCTTGGKGREIWPVLPDCRFPVKALAYPRSSREAAAVYERLSHEVHGSILYASKARLMSLGFGLWYRSRSGVPLIADYDDDEKSFVQYGGPLWRRNLCALRDLLCAHPGRRPLLRRLEGEMFKADALTVCSSLFQGRLGGTVIPHGRDPRQFDPSRYRSEEMKSRYELAGKKVVLFLGTPQPHKGLQDLILAFRSLRFPDICLLLIGVDPERPPAYLDLNEPRLRVLRGCEWRELPEFLALADVIAIPQRRAPNSIGQMPAKLTDAMAMAKPIVASSLSDIPRYLDGRGYLFEPGNVQDLAGKLAYVFEHPDEAEARGQEARKYFLKNLTYEAMAERLAEVLEELAKKPRVSHGSEIA